MSIFTVTSYSSTLNFERRLWYSFSFKSYWSESTDINVAINFKTPVFEGLKRVFVQIMVQLILPRNRAPKIQRKKKTSKVCSKMCFDIKFSITQFNPTWPGYGLTVQKAMANGIGQEKCWSFHSLNSSPFRPNLLTQKYIKQKDKEKNHQNENTKTNKNKYKAKPNIHKVEIKKQSSLCGVTLIVLDFYTYCSCTASTTWFI